MVKEKYCKINFRKIELLSQLLVDDENKKLIEAAEENDIQFRVVENINKIIDDEKKSGFIIVSIALVSYMLSTKGELHWKMLEDFVSENKKKDISKTIQEFVLNSSSLRLYRNGRVKRLKKIIDFFLPVYLRKYSVYKEDIRELIRDLSHVLKAPKNSKTIIFAAKMFYYHLRVLYEKHAPPLDIPIPVDYRISLISVSNGLILLNGNMRTIREKALYARQYCDDEIRKAWKIIAEKTKIPSIRLDSLLWVLGKCMDAEIGNKMECIEETLNIKISEKQKRFLEEILGLKLDKGKN